MLEEEKLDELDIALLRQMERELLLETVYDERRLSDAEIQTLLKERSVRALAEIRRFLDEDTPDDSFSRYVRSVIVFGRIAPVEDHSKAMEKAWGLAMHIFPEQTEFYRNDLKRNESRVQVLELVPEHITGKRVHEQ